MADSRSLALIFALSVFAVLIFAIAVACNATSVATVNWVSTTVRVSGSTDGQVVLGLWRVCTKTPVQSAWTCANYDPTLIAGSSADLRYIYVSRALSLAPPAISIVITLPLVLMGLIARKGIVLAFAAGTAVLEAACLFSALVVFYMKTVLLFGNAVISGTDIETIPSWAFYLGGAGVLFYLFGALWLFFMGIVVSMVMEGQRRNSHSSGGAVELSSQASTEGSYNYSPFTAFSE